MMFTSTSLSLLLGISPLFQVALGVAVARIAPRDEVPGFSYDPDTTSYCSWWVDLVNPAACGTILSENAITLETFRRWVRFPIAQSKSKC